MPTALETAAARTYLLARAEAVHAPPLCSPGVFQTWRAAEKLLASILKERETPLQVDAYVFGLECDGALEVLQVGCPHRPQLKTESIPAAKPERSPEKVAKRKSPVKPELVAEPMTPQQFRAAGIVADGRIRWTMLALSEFARVGHRSVSDARARIASKRPDLADSFTTAKLGRLGPPSIVADARGCVAVLSAVPQTRWTTRAIEYLQTVAVS